MKFFKRYELWLHGIGWTVFISLPLLTLPSFLWNRTDLISLGMTQLLTSLVIIGTFYYNLNRLTPDLLNGGTPSRFWIPMFVLLVVTLSVKMLSFYLFPPAYHLPPRMPGVPEGGPGHGPRSPWPGIPAGVISFCFAQLIASMIALFRHNSRSEEARQQMVLEKVSAELAMLKLQVSPHFLFNTLNNIRWLARKKSDLTEMAIVTLAQLLRYMIYQAQQERVPLRQEVEHLQHYINLQKMRLTALHPVSFTAEGDLDAHEIEPLLFIPFVENAFKYGPVVREGGLIRIHLAVQERTLTFVTENPAPASSTVNPASEDSGIGITNVRKRLTLHYPAQHSLEIESEKATFSVRLTLHLHYEQTSLPRH